MLALRTRHATVDRALLLIAEYAAMNSFPTLRSFGCSALLLTAAWGCAAGSDDTTEAAGNFSNGAAGSANEAGAGGEGTGVVSDAGTGGAGESGGSSAGGAAGSGGASLGGSGSAGDAQAGGTGSGYAGGAGAPEPLCGGVCFPDSPDSCSDAGLAGAGGADDTDYGCYIRPGPMAVCEVAGLGDVGEECRVATDCAPGLGCALGESSGYCRPYCCEGLCTGGEACLALQTAELPPARTTAPFCVPPNLCELGGSGCGAGLACMLHADGTTWCEAPGDGKAGDGCPCAEGFVCAGAQPQCRQLCEESDSEVCDGVCQVVPTFPDGYGICVD